MAGTYKARKKDGSVYYRSSVTYRSKHISIGSFDLMEDAALCYEEARIILDGDANSPIFDAILEKYHTQQIKCLPFQKAVILCNFHDNDLYISNPLYLRQKYFEYYLDENTVLKFDIDDLFYYSSHKIQKRGGHLFVEDYGMQITLGARYGIKAYGIHGKDYRHINNDLLDYRYDNLEIYNKYNGVEYLPHRSVEERYRAFIHVKGYVTLGYYPSAIEAAIAYNKGITKLITKGSAKKYTPNYIEGIKQSEYKKIYSDIKIRI